MICSGILLRYIILRDWNGILLLFTWYPWLANIIAQLFPTSPDPTTPTFFPLLALISVFFYKQVSEIGQSSEDAVVS